MSAILVYLNNEKSAILVFQTNPVGVELFCNAKTFFCFIKEMTAGHVSENAPLTFYCLTVNVWFR